VYLKVLSACALAGACALESAAWGQTTAPDTKPIDTAQLAAPATSQPTAGTAEQPTPSAAPCCKLTALTPVELEILTPASSKTSKQGEQIRIRVIERILVDGKVVIPAGTEGYAEIIQASRGAFGGKGGELVMGAPYLLLGQQRIGLKRFRYGPSAGRDNTGQAMLISAVAGGVFGLMVGGGNIDVASGARANAVVTTDTIVAPQPEPAPVSSSTTRPDAAAAPVPASAPVPTSNPTGSK
jgi:hypothetical protein